MNICLLNDSFPPVIDGVVNVVMNYADYLISDHNAGVMVGTPRYPGADYSQYPYPVIPCQSFDTAALASGYRTGNPFSGRTVAALAAFRPDIIHAPRGTLPMKKRAPSDYLVHMTARGMEEREKARRARKEWFHDFRETAVGMMENMQEAEEELERLRGNAAENLRQGWNARRKE